MNCRTTIGYVLCGILSAGCGWLAQATWRRTFEPNFDLTDAHVSLPDREAFHAGAADLGAVSPFDPEFVRRAAAMTAGDCRSRLVAMADERIQSPAEAKQLWDRLADLDIRSAFAFLTSREDFPEKQYAFGTLLRRWATANPAEALDAACSLAGETARDNAAQLVIREWARNDPATALAELDRQPREVVGSLHKPVLEALMAIDPEAVIESRLSRESRTAQSEFNLCLDAWMKLDPARAQEWVSRTDRLSARQRESAKSLVLNTLAITDPAAAAAAIPDLRYPISRNSAFRTVLDHWEPSSALAWARELDNGPLKFQSLAMIASRLAESDPEAALALSEELPGDQLDRSFFKEFAGRQQFPNADASFEWASQIADPQRRSVALNLFLGRADPVEAAAWILANDPPDLPATLYSRIAQQMARSDRQSALNWATSLPDPEARSRALAGISE